MIGTMTILRRIVGSLITKLDSNYQTNTLPATSVVKPVLCYAGRAGIKLSFIETITHAYRELQIEDDNCCFNEDGG